jgi:hypothetical protein
MLALIRNNDNRVQWTRLLPWLAKTTAAAAALASSDIMKPITHLKVEACVNYPTSSSVGLSFVTSGKTEIVNLANLWKDVRFRDTRTGRRDWEAVLQIGWSSK